MKKQTYILVQPEVKRGKRQMSAKEAEARNSQMNKAKLDWVWRKE